MIKILYEDNHLLVVVKPINMPVCLDESKDKDLLSELKDYIKDKYHKTGNVYLGLVHRLDRPVGGVMVFAKTSKSASRLSDQIRNNKLQKIYYAVVLGKLEGNGTYIDKLLKDNKTNMVTVNKDGKEAVLNYETIKYMNNMTLVRILLKTGRSHQIRVQFSSRNHPLYGDQRYNTSAKTKEQIALFASSLSFYHPITNELLTFEEPLPSRYPFSVFK